MEFADIPVSDAAYTEFGGIYEGCQSETGFGLRKRMARRTKQHATRAMHWLLLLPICTCRLEIARGALL